VNRLAGDYASYLFALAASQLNPLADQHDWVPTADLLKAQEALVVDVADDQTDLINVADDRKGASARVALYARR
jgi:hypothetical protein